MEGPEPVLRSIVIVVFSQLYPTRRKKVKADSEEEEGEGDQQQASFLIIFIFEALQLSNTYIFKFASFGSSFNFIYSFRISEQGLHCTKS